MRKTLLKSGNLFLRVKDEMVMQKNPLDKNEKPFIIAEVEMVETNSECKGIIVF